MKKKNKLIGLILSVLMLVGSAAAYADPYISDPISSKFSSQEMEERLEAEATPAPVTSEEIIPPEAIVEEQSAETVLSPEANEEIVAPEAIAEEQPYETVSDPLESRYQRNELGELILDEQGNPILVTPNESEAQHQGDAEDSVVPNENGEPNPEDGQTSAPEEVRSDLSLAVIKTWMDADTDTKYGDTVTIFYEIQNFSGWSYTLQWQRKGADGWTDVLGATGETYSFILTEENLNTEWRVRVDVILPEADEDAMP